MTEKFDEFIEELQQDIRQERMLQLWKKYGKKITYAAGGIVGLVALYTAWQHYDLQIRSDLSERYTSALEFAQSRKTEQAINALEGIVANGSGIYLQQSKLLLADLLKDSGPKQDLERSLSLYEEISKDSKNSPVIRDLATLMAISLRISKNEEPGPLMERLKPLLAEGAPWRLQAREIEGFLLSQLGENTKAAEVFASLARENQVPHGMLTRAQVITQLLLNSSKVPHQ